MVFFGIWLVFSVSFLFLFSDIALFAEYGNILVFILLIPVFIVSGFYAVFRFLMKLPLNAYFSGIMFGISSFLIASLFLSPSLLAMGMGILSEESVALIVSIPAYWLLGVFSYYIAVCMIKIIRIYENDKTIPNSFLIPAVFIFCLWICSVAFAIWAEQTTAVLFPFSNIILISVIPVLIYAILFKTGDGSRFLSYIVFIDVAISGVFVGIFVLMSELLKFIGHAFADVIFLLFDMRFQYHGYVGKIGEFYFGCPVCAMIMLIVASVIIVGLLRILEYLTHPFFLKILPDDKKYEDNMPDTSADKTPENESENKITDKESEDKITDKKSEDKIPERKKK